MKRNSLTATKALSAIRSNAVCKCTKSSLQNGGANLRTSSRRNLRENLKSSFSVQYLLFFINPNVDVALYNAYFKIHN